MALGDVHREFIRWRTASSAWGKTPETLRRRAVGLLEHHYAFHVCRALGINATVLKRWAADERDRGITSSEVYETDSFVALDAESLPSGPANTSGPTSTLTVELPGGIRVHCYSVHCVAGIVTLTRNHVAN